MSHDEPAALRAAHYLRRGYQGLVTEDFRTYLKKWIPLSVLIGLLAELGTMVFQ